MDDETYHYTHTNPPIQTAQVLRCIAQSLLAAADEMERSQRVPMITDHAPLEEVVPLPDTAG
jgi:hypothetical protein